MNDITATTPTTSTITFTELKNAEKPIIKITSEGFFYKGVLIEDAGECYKAFMKFLNEANSLKGNKNENHR